MYSIIVLHYSQCGASAFARVANAWVSEDQTLPAGIAARVVKRDGTQPEVKALRLDTQFNLVDASKYGSSMKHIPCRVDSFADQDPSTLL